MDIERYHRILRQCFPDLSFSSLEFLGGGSFRIFEVNTNRTPRRRLIFRFPHSLDGGEFLRRERRLYDHLQSRLPLPIPHYEFFAEGCPEFRWPVAGYQRLEGMALQDCPFDHAILHQVAAQIGEFLSQLHGLGPEVAQAIGNPAYTPAQSRERQRIFYGEIRKHAFPRLTAEERAWTVALFEPFLDSESNWQYEPVLIHGDFDASNILCDPDSGTVVGIIDFEDAGLGDPAWDFCAMLAEQGAGFLWDLIAAYRLSLDAAFAERVTFHARRVLFHELMYGIEVNEQRFIDNSLERLHRAMDGLEPIGGWLAVSTSETRSVEGFPD